jgi:hypothetical protein
MPMTMNDHNHAKSAVGTDGSAKQFRQAMALSAALGVVCFGVALLAAHFVGHQLLSRPSCSAN